MHPRTIFVDAVTCGGDSQVRAERASPSSRSLSGVLILQNAEELEECKGDSALAPVNCVLCRSLGNYQKKITLFAFLPMGGFYDRWTKVCF